MPGKRVENASPAVLGPFVHDRGSALTDEIVSQSESATCDDDHSSGVSGTTSWPSAVHPDEHYADRGGASAREPEGE